MPQKYDLDNIVLDYQLGLSIPQIIKKYGCWENTVRNILKRNGILKDRYFEKLNHDYFENITTEHQAYWLGFLTADGCVVKNRLRLELKVSDVGHLEKFKSDLNIKNKICFFTRKTNFITCQKTCSIQCSSPKLISDLAKLYVVPHKTGITQMPMLSQDLIRHYFRGLIDGDGSIYKTKNYIGLELTGDKDIILKFSEYCNKITPHKASMGKYANCFRFRLSKLKAKKIIYDLYHSSSVYLDRKMDIVLSNNVLDSY